MFAREQYVHICVESRSLIKNNRFMLDGSLHQTKMFYFWRVAIILTFTVLLKNEQKLTKNWGENLIQPFTVWVKTYTISLQFTILSCLLILGKQKFINQSVKTNTTTTTSTTTKKTKMGQGQMFRLEKLIAALTSSLLKKRETINVPQQLGQRHIPSALKLENKLQIIERKKIPIL